ncbi:hypothetical protein SFC27_05595 [Bacillus licheniformis]|jgi:hypothetical protein|uniref:Uncharacterized protein n=1 Tax=Bacillus sonorensis TaxID=119858 RepID=A0ABM6LDF7_9BACI|nr:MULTISPECIES: hypothetical protein [Bacillus]MBY8348038.1 hypothetical protein [Bacillus sp. PCH94]ARC60462.1 hypothetical protein BaDB11_01820 [Bacillus licheniformis]ASB87319.1 hypothetical protein S101395_00765 [Bacillus sonorensis]KJE32974.1 phage domain protein [Bacillus licheniformis]KJE33342.1 phage domain protein [Bacillus licheniformis]
MSETGEELHNHPDAFDYLTPGEQKHLTSWIETNLKPTKTFNDRRTSYGLKHLFEDTGGFYIGNGAFKGAMIKCGFKAKDESALNWVFNVSERSVNQTRIRANRLK